MQQPLILFKRNNFIGKRQKQFAISEKIFILLFPIMKVSKKRKVKNVK